MMDSKARKILWIIAGIMFLIAGIIKTVKGNDISGIVVSFIASALSFLSVYLQGKLKEKNS